MMELIRNCSHGSEFATYSEDDQLSGRAIIKVSTTSAGIRSLEREFAGWEWYQEQRPVNQHGRSCRIIQRRDNYIKIRIKFIEGVTPDYRNGLEENAGIVDGVIKHYCETWRYSEGKKAALHGDLSLDNVIYNAKGINFIDWEHFSPEAAPWGFDALYFLFESLWFGMKERQMPTRAEALIILRNMKRLASQGSLDPEVINKPLMFTVNFIRQNASIWDGQISRFPDKFPILRFNGRQISAIDKILSI